MTSLRDDILSTMPPIGGVANGAMVQSNFLFSDLTYEALQEVLKPKVDGSVILDEVFLDDNLDFFILFSSISAITGQPFQANYDAANNVSLTTFPSCESHDGLIPFVVHDWPGVPEASSQPPCLGHQIWTNHRPRIHSKD